MLSLFSPGLPGTGQRPPGGEFHARNTDHRHHRNLPGRSADGQRPKLKFGSTEQDVSARGERKWDLQAAVTYVAEAGMKAVSEVISVTVTGPATDPCASITPGTAIVFDKMRVGFSVSR